MDAARLFLRLIHRYSVGGVSETFLPRDPRFGLPKETVAQHAKQLLSVTDPARIFVERRRLRGANVRRTLSGREVLLGSLLLRQSRDYRPK